MLVLREHFAEASEKAVRFGKRVTNEPALDLAALQNENTLKTSRHVARITGDDQGVKASLATQSGNVFSLTSSPRAR